MSRKLLSSALALVILLSISHVALAEEKKEDVEPNRYEKREINIRNFYRDNLIEKRELPEAQKNLTFEPPVKTESEELADELFQTSHIETNTITSKAAQLELFSMSDKQPKRDTEEEVASDSNLLIILMIGIAAIIIAMIFFLIPRLQHTQK